MVNYLALLGWNPGDDREVMSLDEMIQAFKLENIHPTAVKFDEKKLQWMNMQHIHTTPNDVLLKEMVAGLEAKGISTANEPAERLNMIVEMLKPRAHFLKDLADMSVYFFKAPTEYDEKGKRKQWGAGSREIAHAVREMLATVEPFTTPEIEKGFVELTEKCGCKLGDLVGAVRLAVSGVTAGPGLWELFEVVGKAETLRRIEVAEPLMQE